MLTTCISTMGGAALSELQTIETKNIFQVSDFKGILEQSIFVSLFDVKMF